MEDKMKQTAVEWLIEKMLDSGIGICKEWREKAKEMEKQQIKCAYLVGREDEQTLDYYPQKHSEDYYNETYGSNGIKINFVEIPQEQLEKERNPAYKYFDIDETIEESLQFLSTQAQELGMYDTSTQLSDEEIQEGVDEHFSADDMVTERFAFKLGANWYKALLKSKKQ